MTKVTYSVGNRTFNTYAEALRFAGNDYNMVAHYEKIENPPCGATPEQYLKRRSYFGMI